MGYRRLGALVALTALSCVGSAVDSASEMVVAIVGQSPELDAYGLLADGEWDTGAERDRVFRDVANEVALGDVKRRSPLDTIAVFARGQSPSARKVNWNTADVPVRIRSRRQVVLPTRFHIVHPLDKDDAVFEVSIPRFPSGSRRFKITVRQIVEWAVIATNIRYFTERAGVALEASYENTGHAALDADLAAADSDEARALILADTAFRPQRLNVYVLKSGVMTASYGLHEEVEADASGNTRKVVMVSFVYRSGLLAHEVGHAFGLKHTDHCPGFETRDSDPRQNIMDLDAGNAGQLRTYLTEGQTLRMHYDAQSIIHHPRMEPLDLRPDIRNVGALDAWSSTDTHPVLGDTPPSCWRIWADGSSVASDEQGISPRCAHDAISDSVLGPLTFACSSSSEAGDPKREPRRRRPMTVERFLSIDCGTRGLWRAGILLHRRTLADPAFRQQAETALIRAANRTVTGTERARIAAQVQTLIQERAAWLAHPSTANALGAAAVQRAGRFPPEAAIKIEVRGFHYSRVIRAIQGLKILDTPAARAELQQLQRNRDPIIAAAAEAR